MSLHFKPVPFEYDHFKLDVSKTYEYVELAKNVNKSSDRKILLVLDYMPSEDLVSGRLLSGATGELLRNILHINKAYYKEPLGLNEVNWLCVTFNAFHTKNKDTNFQEKAHKDFTARLNFIINEYRPDTVVTFGPDPYKALNKNKIQEYNGNYHHLYGVPTKTISKFGNKKHKFKHVPTLSLNSLVNDFGKGSEMALAGYVTRNLNTALHGSLKYKVSKLKYKTVLVDSIPLFKKMMKYLSKATYVAIDTETENLNRRVNKMLTIQFASTSKRAFVLPVFHKDSPFTGKELNYILKTLRKYFEGANNNKYHIYANANFDLTVLRNNCGVRYFHNNVWDLFAGEFCFDENLKFLNSLTGKWYYSLLNISMQYGCDAYYKAEFGKDQRKTIATVDLDGPLLEYCALDVVIPIHLFRLQLHRAKDIGYTKYEDVVGLQISDMLHTFSTLEYNGSYTDIEYLFYLNERESPIRKEISDVEEALYTTKGAKKANAQLAKNKGMPIVGLLGSSNTQIFDIRKEEHVRILFFEVLKLKPLGYGKAIKGKSNPKVDKLFQGKYKDVKEVALFTKLKKADKLFSSYVKAFIKQWGVDADMKFDKRIRPHFGFLDVVTGRTSAKKPSLHQIPQRSDLGKHIKRLFIVEEGRILIKVDYSAHEVRCWAIFTLDKKLAQLFAAGRKLRNKFKIWPDKKLGERVALEGDVHKINAAYFFGVDIRNVSKEIRDAVKAVIFGLIYQQGDKGLAKSTGQTVEAVRELAQRFRKKYPVGVNWFDDVKKFARKNFYVESPLGRRRHTWGLVVPKSARNGEECASRTERQSVNSPIQGMGSDFLINGSRCVEKLKFDHYLETGDYPDMYQSNSVHDSIAFSSAYEHFWLSIKIIEEGLTTEVAKVTKERHGLDFVVPLEIDFDIGDNERDVTSWTFSLKQLSYILKKTLKAQKKAGHKVDVQKVHDNIMFEQYDDMPSWAQKQLWNLGNEIGGVDPRSEDEVMNINVKKAA